MRDLKEFRKIQGDDTLGGMVICETSEQARRLYDVFKKMGRISAQAYQNQTS